MQDYIEYIIATMCDDYDVDRQMLEEVCKSEYCLTLAEYFEEEYASKFDGYILSDEAVNFTYETKEDYLFISVTDEAAVKEDVFKYEITNNVLTLKMTENIHFYDFEGMGITFPLILEKM